MLRALCVEMSQGIRSGWSAARLTKMEKACSALSVWWCALHFGKDTKSNNPESYFNRGSRKEK